MVEALGFPDSYAVLRETRVSDNRGGTTVTVTSVEAGSCALRTVGNQPEERALADRLGWSVPYSVDLPFSTILTPRDDLDINGRTFEVGGVLKGGAWAMTATAIVQEVG